MTNTGIAKRLSSANAPSRRTSGALLVKLDIADSEDANRRVLAVLVHLGVPVAGLSPKTRQRCLDPLTLSRGATGAR